MTFRIRLASIAVANSDFILYFCTPIFNDLYPPMIFEFSKVTKICEIPVHSLSNTYHLLPQNRFTNVPVIRDEKVPEIHRFFPNTPFYEFLKFIIL